MNLVSIIVPFFEVEVYIDVCLSSICAQSYQNLEIICVNGQSMDNSATLVRLQGEKDPRIKLVNQAENNGLGGGRNEGLRHARGKYILFVDSDDWILPDMVETLVNSLEEHDVDYVFCSLRGYEDLTGRILPHERPFHSKSVEAAALAGPIDFRTHPEYLTDIYPSAYLALRKRVDIQEIGAQFPEMRLAEDHEFHYLCGFKCGAAVYVDKALYMHRRGRHHQLSNDSTERSMQIFGAIEGSTALFGKFIPESACSGINAKIILRLTNEKLSALRRNSGLARKFLSKSASLLKDYTINDLRLAADDVLSEQAIAILAGYEPMSGWSSEGSAITPSIGLLSVASNEICLAVKRNCGPGCRKLEFVGTWRDVTIDFRNSVDILNFRFRSILYVNAAGPIDLRHAFICESRFAEDETNEGLDTVTSDAHVLECHLSYQPGLNVVEFDEHMLTCLRGAPDPTRVRAIYVGGIASGGSVYVASSYFSGEGWITLVDDDVTTLSVSSTSTSGLKLITNRLSYLLAGLMTRVEAQ